MAGKMTEQEYLKEKGEQYHRVIADALIEKIQKNERPFEKGWVGNGMGNVPVNGVSGKAYRGGNALITDLVSVVKGYTDGRFFTHAQITALGGSVQKGEHGYPICFPATHWSRNKKDEHGKPVLDGDGKPVKEFIKYENGPKMKYYTIFAAEQCNNVPVMKVERERFEWTSNERAEELVKNYGIEVRHGGNRAYYLPSEDFIQLPERDQFKSEQDYSSTLLHECSHSTGSKDRLNRDGITGGHAFGSEGYAQEELVAELSAYLVHRQLGLAPSSQITEFEGAENNVAYMQSWLKALRNDPKDIYNAVQQAAKAQEYLMQHDPERIKAQELERRAHEQGNELQGEPLLAQATTADFTKARWAFDGFGAAAQAKLSGDRWLEAMGVPEPSFKIYSPRNGDRVWVRFNDKKDEHENEDVVANEATRQKFIAALKGEDTMHERMTVLIGKRSALEKKTPVDLTVGRSGENVLIAVHPTTIDGYDPGFSFTITPETAKTFAMAMETDTVADRIALVKNMGGTIEREDAALHPTRFAVHTLDKVQENLLQPSLGRGGR